MKNQVQALKNAHYVSSGYDKAGSPNVTSNPLPNHSGPKINDVLESPMEGRKSSTRDVITLVEVIYEKLVQARFFRFRREEAVRKEELNKDYCQYHAEIQSILYKITLSFGI